MHNAPYKNKRVAIIGLSTEGTDAARFFVQQKAHVVCLDRRIERELGDVYSSMTKLQVTFRLGKNYLSELNHYDLIVRSPGVALSISEIERALKRHQIVTSATKLFFSHCSCPIVGVTGTKGKGTTTTLIGEILEKAGRKVFVGGNIGTPLLSQVSTIKQNDIVILELSSFQLEDLDTSPHIAVILNITQDHLVNTDPLSSNFHQSRWHYIEAKKNLVKYQKSHDIAVINADYVTSKTFAQFTKAHVYFYSKKDSHTSAFVEEGRLMLSNNGNNLNLCSVNEFSLRGEHNWENILAASLTTKLLNVPAKIIKDVVIKFKGLEHRLELVDEYHGIKYYDDSFSTTPETAIAAIKAFHEPVILIAGGSEKGSNYDELGRAVVYFNVKTVILIGTTAPKIESAIINLNLNIRRQKPKIIRGLKSMKEIVFVASAEARSGDVVLLSPGCASFDMFKNYKDRGDQFKSYVKKIRAEKS